MNPLLVIKLGGSMERAIDFHDLARLTRHYNLVIVHGVSERMAELSRQRGVPVEMLTSPGGHSSRYTPPLVRDLFVEAATQVNDDVVNGLAACGVHPLGMTGSHVVVDGRRKTAVRAQVNGRTRVIRDDYTGSIEGVNAALLREALDSGYIPVVPPLARSIDGALNIDGDRAAAAIAAALRAETLVILSNVRGLYRSYPDESSFVAHLPYSHLDLALDWAEGRMKRKVLSVRDALTAGVDRVIIADGRGQHAVSQALAGEGTVCTR